MSSQITPEQAAMRMVSRWQGSKQSATANGPQPMRRQEVRDLAAAPLEYADAAVPQINNMMTPVSSHVQPTPAASAPGAAATTARASARVATIANHLATEVVEPAKSVPVLTRCDVLVVGAGPAGLSAALGARRAGVDVVLMERFGCFGGVITTVGMETLGWYRYEGTVDCEGIGREMERVAERMGGSTKWPYNDSDCLDAEKFKLISDKLITEAGVRPILHCWCVEVIKGPNGEVQGVITESKSGRRAILAQRVVDCTGDADVAYLAGCPYTVLDKDDRMGCTQVFNVAGVDREKFLNHVDKNPRTYADWSKGCDDEWKQQTTGKEEDLKSPFLKEEFEKAKEDGVISREEAEELVGSWSALSEAGEATNLNLAHIKGLDCTNVEDLTKAEMIGRQKTDVALKALKHVLPGFENAKLRNIGMTIGIRDTRKIVGRHNLTADEVKNQAKFNDTIGVFPEFIDGYNILILPSSGRYFQVPLGCCLPLGTDNLLVAGRCVAGDKTSHAAMRNMMACTVTGQGAGVAAAVSVKTGRSVSNVDINEVHKELMKQQVKID